MRLKVIQPTQIMLDQVVGKIVAEAQNGSFGMLPHHIDFVAALTAGILVYETENGDERYLGIDNGILVKCGNDVFVSTLNAVSGDDLHTLREIVHKQYTELNEKQKSERSALARLEAGVVRRFMELQGRGR